MAADVLACPSEAKEMDLLELDRLKAVANLHKYQEETRSWRDPKVKLQELDVGNSAFLRSPRTKSSKILESKWAGPYVVTENPRPGAYHLLDFLGRMIEHSWNMENLNHFLFKSTCNK
jgi:hypothetical protein